MPFLRAASLKQVPLGEGRNPIYSLTYYKICSSPQGRTIYGKLCIAFFGGIILFYNLTFNVFQDIDLKS
jgi:hypothetical protein